MKTWICFLGRMIGYYCCGFPMMEHDEDMLFRGYLQPTVTSDYLANSDENQPIHRDNQLGQEVYLAVRSQPETFTTIMQNTAGTPHALLKSWEENCPGCCLPPGLRCKVKCINYLQHIEASSIFSHIQEKITSLVSPFADNHVELVNIIVSFAYPYDQATFHQYFLSPYTKYLAKILGLGYAYWTALWLPFIFCTVTFLYSGIQFLIAYKIIRTIRNHALASKENNDTNNIYYQAYMATDLDHTDSLSTEVQSLITHMQTTENKCHTHRENMHTYWLLACILFSCLFMRRYIVNRLLNDLQYKGVILWVLVLFFTGGIVIMNYSMSCFVNDSHNS